MERCRWEVIADRYGCVAPFMPLPADRPECSDFDSATYLMEEYQEWSDSPTSKDACRERCPPSCQKNLYSAQVVKTAMLQDCKQSEFHIYFSSGEMQVRLRTLYTTRLIIQYD